MHPALEARAASSSVCSHSRHARRGDRRLDATPDGAPLDASCVDYRPYVPVDVTGTSPDGSLASLRYMFGRWWPCGRFDVVLVEGTECETGLGPALVLSTGTDVTSPGAVVPATVTHGELETTGSFRITRLAEDAIVGRFSVTAAGWDIDLEVDVQPRPESCTL